MSQEQTELSRQLERWAAGHRDGLDALVDQLYGELKRVAQSYLNRENAGHTLQATALVHEAYLKLSNSGSLKPNDRVHFIALAARMMRQVLVDSGRHRQAGKRNMGERLTLTTQLAGDDRATQNSIDLLDLDQALDRLEQLNTDQARVVELRYFGGLTISETAASLDQSESTVNRNWRAASTWLYRQLETPE